MDFRAYQSLGLATPQHEKQPPDGQINMHTGRHAMFLPRDLDADRRVGVRPQRRG